MRASGEDVAKLREALDRAVYSSQMALRDTTRLTRLFSVLSEPVPLELMLDRVLSTLSELFAADIVVLLDPVGTGAFTPLAAVGLPEEMLHLPLSCGDEGNAAIVMAAGRPLLKTGGGADANLEPQLREVGAEEVVWVPVIDSHAARGTLILARCRREPFIQADVDLLTSMAYRIGLAMEQAQRSVQLVQIVQTGREIGRHLDESQVCGEAVRMLPAVLWADGAALVLNDPFGSPRCVAQVGLDHGWRSIWGGLTERLLSESSLARAQPYSTADIRNTDDWLSLNQPGNCPVRALLAVPIQREDRVQGVLYAVRFSTSLFTPDTNHMAMLYAGQISAALENARLYRLVNDELAERVRAEQQLRESEERFKLALMGGDLGMWDWNVASGEVRFSERWVEMLGYSMDEIEPCIRTWEERIHPDDVRQALDALKAHLEGRTPYFETEHRLLSRSGKWLWVLNKGKVTHRDGQGRPTRVVGTQLDIHDAKEIQAERLLIEQQNHQIWRAESLSRMAGGIAHHFNNLLGAVMGNLELALCDLPQEMEARSRLVHAMKASSRAAEISRLLLAYLGQMTTKREPLDLAETAEEALSLLMASLPRNVRLRADLKPQGLSILADGVHIKQVLTNLVTNAVEAIGDEEGEITLSVGRMTKGEVLASKHFPLDWVPQTESYGAISISDTGCGLDSASLENIFEPFFSTKFTGRGLGLPVALGLVRAHEGAIAVESRLGRGVTFRVIFPLLVSEDALLCRKAESAPWEPSQTPGLALVVDDDPMIRMIANAQLAQLGYEVLEACDGIEAVETFRTRQDEFRLVLLDLIMPRMGGWETLATLRALRPDIVVVLASGYDEARKMLGEHREQPHAFLHKPYELKDLKAALGAAHKVLPAS
jgi:PAS domain S-box-containing protein